jgi:hypothetical protein
VTTEVSVADGPVADGSEAVGDSDGARVGVGVGVEPGAGLDVETGAGVAAAGGVAAGVGVGLSVIIGGGRFIHVRKAKSQDGSSCIGSQALDGRYKAWPSGYALASEYRTRQLKAVKKTIA